MSQYHDLNTILTALRTRMIQKKSGTFFIATDDNASARFALDKGQLTHCSFKRENGQAAVDAFITLTAGRYSFSDAPFPFRDKSRVEHETALQTLGIMLPQQPAFPSRTSEAPTAPTSTPTQDKKPEPKYRMYRGQKILIEEPEQPQAEEAPYRMYRGQKILIEKPEQTSSQPDTPKKKVRYYRGQRIED